MGRVAARSVSLTAKVSVRPSVQPASPPPAAAPTATPTPTPAKPFASSSTVVLPRINLAPRPSTGSTRTKATDWKCSSCGDTLRAKSVLEGNARLLGDRLVCTECTRRAERKANQNRQHRKIVGAVVGTSVVVFGALIILFPAQSLVLGIAAGAFLIVSGMLAFTLNSVMRMALSLAGAAAIGGCAWGLLALHDAATVKQTENFLTEKAQQIRGLLKQNCFHQAQLSLESLDRSSRNMKGTYVSADAQSTVQKLRLDLDGWLRQTYGDLTEDEHALLLKLLAKSSGNRIRALKISGSTLQVTAVAESPEPQLEAQHIDVNKSGSGDPQKDQANALIRFVSAEMPQVQDVSVTLVSAENTELKTFSSATLK